METDPVVSISTNKLDEMYCEEVNQCEQSLSQCSISKEYESQDKSANKCVLQESPSLCHQIHFACTLNLMPTCLQNLSDNENSNPCIPVANEVENMTSTKTTDFLRQIKNETAGFGGNISVLKYVTDNSYSHNNSNNSQELEMDNYKLCGNREKKEEYEGESVNFVSTDASVNTSFTAGSVFAEKISNDDMIKGIDRHLEEDVKITLDTILETCSKVSVMDYGNSHTSINQLHEQCASGKKILDLKAENESEMTECTSLDESLPGDSCHTKPSTINEPNISDLKTISEPSTDCQVPVAMPFHDNNQQDIRRSHENPAALLMHSSEKGTQKTGKFIEDSSEQTDPSMQYTQVRRNILETEDRVSVSPLRSFLDNGPCDKGENEENDNFLQNKNMHFGDIQLTKLDLISGNAQFDQGKMQVPEQSPLSSGNLTDCPGGSALIEVGPSVHMSTSSEEERLVTRSKDIYIRENDLMQAHLNLNNSQNDTESSAPKVEENHPEDPSCSLSSIQFEMVHSNETRNKTVVILSPLQNQSKGNIHHDMSTFDTQTENPRSCVCSVEEGLCCSLPGSTERVSSFTEVTSTCLPGDHVTQGNSTCSAFSLPMNNTGTNDHVSRETEYLCTQQFTASVSQASIAEYLRDTTENYGLDPIDQMPVPEEEGLSAAHPGDDHTVPHDLHLPTDESDVVMYEEDTLPIKVVAEQESAQVPGPCSPCFKWKYAPSACLDDISPGPKDSKPCEEETLLMIYPLRTCRRPIRVGLSKRFRAKSLHANLKP